MREELTRVQHAFKHFFVPGLTVLLQAHISFACHLDHVSNGRPHDTKYIRQTTLAPVKLLGANHRAFRRHFDHGIAGRLVQAVLLQHNFAVQHNVNIRGVRVKVIRSQNVILAQLGQS